LLPGSNACLLEYTLRCGSPFIAGAMGLAIGIETAVDIEEVSDLRKLVFRQLLQVLNPCVCGFSLGDANQLRLASVPGQDPKILR
jgi:hypothetical protein